MKCLARQYGDQMICAPCGLNWDVNDPDPPECQKVDRRTKTVKQVAQEAVVQARGMPTELPPDIAVDMVRAYKANARDGITGQIVGMQAAYRLFLDRVEL